MKKRGKWQFFVGLLVAALFIYWAFFMERELFALLFYPIGVVIVLLSFKSSIYEFYSRRRRK